MKGKAQQQRDLSPQEARELGVAGSREECPSVAYLFEGIFAWHRCGPRTTRACPRCGTTLRDVVLHHRVGCSGCYALFDQAIDRILRLHREDASHRGRLPQRLARYRRIFVERERVLNNLSLAVEREDFESAALLRDQLQELSRDTPSSCDLSDPSGVPGSSGVRGPSDPAGLSDITGHADS
ncbi:hypothetical protein AU468_07815 [Alkalispirochaeta sphaeroplastigenens]|uniref:UVR domain-containing protein n=2 Tax=Spirochaetaceae TaxID=137 RepID=A0A2S4JQ27_9SPIO|nr:hypothetical protein AU468_07815 [Alkalispirochaeta sphaeroplastigenens]